MHRPEASETKDLSRLEPERLRDTICLDDVSCPVGSYCQPMNMRCALDCLDGSAAEDLQCPPDTFCDLRGQCQRLSEAGSDPGVRAYAWVGVPDEVVIEDEGELMAALQQLGGRQAPAVARAIASDGLEVSCDESGRTWGSTCLLRNWEAVTPDRRQSSILRVRWAQPSSSGPGTLWLASSLARPGTYTVEVVRPSTLATRAGVFRGFARRHDNPSILVPVSARVEGDRLELYEPRRLAFGKKPLSFSIADGTGGDRRATVWFSARPQTSELPFDERLAVSGRLMARWEASAFRRAPNSRTLTGSVTTRIFFGVDTQWDVELVPVPFAPPAGYEDSNPEDDSGPPQSDLSLAMAAIWDREVLRTHPAIESLLAAQRNLPEIMLDVESAGEAEAISRLRRENDGNEEEDAFLYCFESSAARDEGHWSPATDCPTLLRKMVQRLDSRVSPHWIGHGVFVRDGQPEGQKFVIKKFAKRELFLASEAWSSLAPGLAEQHAHGPDRTPLYWLQHAVYDKPGLWSGFLRQEGGQSAASSHRPRGPLYSQCLRDLEGAPGSQGLDSTQCLNPSVFYRSLGALKGAAGDECGTFEEKDGKLADLLLSRWLVGHTLVANTFLRQSEHQTPRTESARPTEPASTGPGDGALTSLSIDRTLAHLDAAWALLLSADVAPVLQRISGDVLTHPGIPAPSGRHQDDYDGGRGLIVAGLDLARAHLQVLRVAASCDVVMDDRRDDKDSACQRTRMRSRRQDSQRLVIAAVSTLSELATSVRRIDEARWLEQIQFGQEQFDRQLAALPWDSEIVGEPVPLLFGDVAGDDNRYFAASDNLSGLFETAVTKVLRSDDRTREQWLRYVNQQNSESTVEINEDRREEAIRRHYGAEILHLCGWEGIEAENVLHRIESGSLSLDECLSRFEGAEEERLDRQALKGDIGMAMAAVVQARDDWEVAHKSLEEISDRVCLQSRHCQELEKDLAGEQGMKSEHTEHEKERRSKKFYAHHAQIVARNMQAAGGIFKTIFSGGMNIASAAANASAEIYEEHLNCEMEQQEADFRLALEEKHTDRQMRDCRDSIESAEIGRKSAAAQVKRRIHAWKAATRQVEERRNHLRQIVDEGRTALNRQRVAAPQISGVLDDWLDEETRDYGRSLRRCKKLGEIAIRALEYEMQESLPLGADLAASTTAHDLERVFEHLRDLKRVRLVRGGGPQTHKRIVSLRRHVLRWRDEQEGGGSRDGTSGEPLIDAGLLSWAGLQLAREAPQAYSVPATERFRRFLSSAQTSLWSDTGAYMGQGMAFWLDPELLSPGGAETARRSTTQCGERLWRINAMVVGRSSHQDHETAAEINVYKRPLFYSRWSRPGSRLSPYQVGRLGIPTSSSIIDDAAEGVTLHQPPTVATLQAHRDVNDDAFFSDGFQDGGSEAFAGQGLFGEYLVVVSPESPIPPSQISDIILKLYYLHTVPE